MAPAGKFLRRQMVRQLRLRDMRDALPAAREKREIIQHDLIMIVHPDLLRGDIQAHIACLMDMIQHVHQLHRHRVDPLHAQALPREQIAHPRLIQFLHDDEGHALFFNIVQTARDVLMVQLHLDAGFLQPFRPRTALLCAKGCLDADAL